MDVVPSMIEAIKLSSKFFQRHQLPYDGSDLSMSLVQPQQQESRENNTDDINDSVHANWMNRVQHASDSTNKDSKKAEQNERLERMNRAASVWMQAVKRFAKIMPQQSQLSSTEDAKQQQREKPSVPYACFLYLWNMQQEHGRVAVRRAALFMSGMLLEKSKDCRFHLEQDDNLSTWITSITKQQQVWNNPETAIKQLPLLQHEASIVLTKLVEKGYANIYPKIGVASKRLRQQCPTIVVDDDDAKSSKRNMVDWRNLRDMALLHGEKEINRLDKLIRKSHIYLERLVPRIGKDIEINQKDDNDDHDDESDIDWEDGDDELLDQEEELMKRAQNEHESKMQHLLDVDRTLAVMESTGTLRGGEIRIDMNDTTSNNVNVQERGNEEALEKLQKIVRLLAGRHLPRLSVWLNAMQCADNLDFSSSALTLLPQESIRLREKLASQFLELKRSIASILASAKRLQLETTEVATTTRQASATIAPGLSTNGQPTSLSSRRQRGTKSRIQIKYKSR